MVYFYLDRFADTRAKYIENLIKEISIFSSSFFGFETEKRIKAYLNWNIFGKMRFKKIPIFHLNKGEILKCLDFALKRCNKILPSNKKKIFIFPCFNPFVKEKMLGVNGVTFSNDTFHLFLYPFRPLNETALKAMTIHEFNHTVFLKSHNISYQKLTLLDFLIIEGLAENFKEIIIKGRSSPWVRALSINQCKIIFKEIKNLLNSKNKKIHSLVFFENKKYPLWTGYALGYQIVKSFLKKHPKMKWEEIMKIPPKEILMKSDFKF